METELRVKPRLIHGETYLQIVSRVHDFISWFIEREGVLYTIRQLTLACSIRQSTQGVAYDPPRSTRIGLNKNTTTIRKISTEVWPFGRPQSNGPFSL
jgi:hypothetical protein